MFDLILLPFLSFLPYPIVAFFGAFVSILLGVFFLCFVLWIIRVIRGG